MICYDQFFSPSRSHHLPKSQMRLVEAWAELHRAELKADWAMLLSGQAPRKIAPLS
ncbi:DUF4160 domain-containing protein [Anaerolineae bacterium CFX7]|nr:DUF4160 domain-containing protein [Anaerolineae bacterium CFX7]